MKSKKRHHTSSDESEDSDASGSSSSDSETDDSSVSGHHYNKKKKKRADSSDSDSDSDDHKRSKKRKHKKKKKKHSKKKRKSDSVIISGSEENFTFSEGEETSVKKKRKHKHKHSKRPRSSSVSQRGEEHSQRRLHSVVKERREASAEEGQPTRTYYQKEYHRSESPEDYEREREVQRFYRGSSKERRHQYHQEQYHNERAYNDRFAQYHQEKYDNREKFGQNSQYTEPNEEYIRKQKEYNDFKRNQRYEDHRSAEEDYHHRRTRDQEERYHQREDPRGFNRYNQYEDRGPKRREFDDRRDYRERRGPPDTNRFREREFPDKKERYHEDEFSSERGRDVRREKIMSNAGRVEKPQASHNRERSRSRSLEEHYKERSRRPEAKEERYKEGRSDDRRDNNPREDRNADREKPPIKAESRQRERKSRFADAEDSKEYSWGKTEVKKEGGKEPADKEKPNFGLSGKLTADANTVNGVVIKYTEPEDAKQPKRRWRFYPFKGDKALPILYIHRQSAFLIGRDKKVVDIMLEHPSISKQHAALQYRATPFTRPDGSQGRRVRPYVIDLDSANGTFVNNKKIDPRRYVELLERDVVKFGFSQREYVLLHENSKDDAQDDDNQEHAVGANVATTDQIKREKRAKAEIVEDGD
ncbi:unnamed protein product [Arctia plantaginis]|uniref:FHA domain-containing protein n=1 Tax=Arctia plantaginis TaxID=874455 RepID=A0A8S1B5F7_ARCPL|nr:unnamed protein product [Arctia plantaginis]